MLSTVFGQLFNQRQLTSSHPKLSIYAKWTYNVNEYLRSVRKRVKEGKSLQNQNEQFEYIILCALYIWVRVFIH